MKDGTRPGRVDSAFSCFELLGELRLGSWGINSYANLLLVVVRVGTSAIFTFDAVNGAQVRLVVTIDLNGSLSVRVRRLRTRWLELRCLIRTLRSIGRSLLLVQTAQDIFFQVAWSTWGLVSVQALDRG